MAGKVADSGGVRCEGFLAVVKEEPVEGPLAGATVMSGVFLVPQLRRLRTTFDGGGVSPAAAAVGLVSTLAWAAYGLGNTNLALVAPSLVGAVQYAVLLAFLRSSGTRTASGAVAALARCLGLGAATAASVAAGHQPLSGLGAALTRRRGRPVHPSGASRPTGASP